MSKSTNGKARGNKSPSISVLRLYLTGHTAKSRAALANLTMLCQEYMHGQYRVQVVDLLKTPQLGKGERIVPVAELAVKLPLPMRQIIGDLATQERILVGIDLAACESNGGN